MKKLNKKGFTIVEMAILIVVIGVVTGLGLYAKNRMSNKDADASGYKTMQPERRYGIRIRMCRLGTSPKGGISVLADGDRSMRVGGNALVFFNGQSLNNRNRTFTYGDLVVGTRRRVNYNGTATNPEIRVIRFKDPYLSSLKYINRFNFNSLPRC